MASLGGGLEHLRWAVMAVVVVAVDAVAGVKVEGGIQHQCCGVELVLVGVVVVAEVANMLLKLMWLAVVKAVPTAQMVVLKIRAATVYSMLKSTKPAVEVVVFVVCL